jgi:hypothetical protein
MSNERISQKTLSKKELGDQLYGHAWIKLNAVLPERQKVTALRMKQGFEKISKWDRLAALWSPLNDSDIILLLLVLLIMPSRHQRPYRIFILGA